MKMRLSIVGQMRMSRWNAVICVSAVPAVTCARQQEQARMRIKALDHVQLAMPSGREAEARAFYSGILGIPETVKPPQLARRGGCWFERGDLKIHLGVEADFRPARKAHPALIVDDLPALKAALAAAGFALRADEPLEGYDRIFVDDPFGNRIELMELARS
jgi:catechol 2,3-dioxygenase-like lactoylglutathione lyase family enzyme